MWAYLTLLEYKPYKIIKDADFFLFGVILRSTECYLQDVKAVREGGVASIENTGNTVQTPSSDGNVFSSKTYGSSRRDTRDAQIGLL